MIREVLASVMVFAAPLAAQTDQLRFEVASVKANKSTLEPRRGGRFDLLPGGRLVVENLPLYMIIATAYNVPFQSFSAPRLAGGPPWIRSDRFDIEAAPAAGTLPRGTPANVRDQEVRNMLRTLLAERFKLSVHEETRDTPVYAIVVAKNGPKLGKADVDETSCPESTGAPPAGINDLPCHQISGGQGRGLHARAATVGDIAVHIANWTDRPVIDQSGLTGLYRIDTEGWSPMRPPQTAPGAEPTPEQLAMNDPSRPTIFMIFDRLGLKLEPRKAPVAMYTIEHVEQPSEN